MADKYDDTFRESEEYYIEIKDAHNEWYSIMPYFLVEDIAREVLHKNRKLFGDDRLRLIRKKTTYTVVE